VALAGCGVWLFTQCSIVTHTTGLGESLGLPPAVLSSRSMHVARPGLCCLFEALVSAACGSAVGSCGRHVVVHTLRKGVVGCPCVARAWYCTMAGPAAACLHHTVVGAGGWVGGEQSKVNRGSFTLVLPVSRVPAQLGRQWTTRLAVPVQGSFTPAYCSCTCMCVRCCRRLSTVEDLVGSLCRLLEASALRCKAASC